MQSEPGIAELHNKLIILAEETGHSYETVLNCAIRLCDAMLREANVMQQNGGK